jgi:hypothetical protein
MWGDAFLSSQLQQGIKVQASLSKKQDPISKITRTKKHVVDYLPSKHKVLSSNPCPAHKSGHGAWCQGLTPSYSGGRDQEDQGSKASLANSS